jgi:hypothetical protein
LAAFVTSYRRSNPPLVAPVKTRNKPKFWFVDVAALKATKGITVEGDEHQAVAMKG